MKNIVPYPLASVILLTFLAGNPSITFAQINLNKHKVAVSGYDIISYHQSKPMLGSEELNSRKPHLWSSSSLYDSEKHHIFQTLFDKEKSELNIFKNNLSFHKGLAQPLNSSVYLEKEKNIQTVSITTFIKKESGSKLNYLDLKKENPELSTILF